MNREKMINLKPCPFCGRTPTIEDCGRNEYFIKCKCGIAQDKLYTQRCDAVRNWNNRKVVDKDLYDLVREQRDIAAGSLGLIYSVYGENFDDVVKVVRCKDCVNRHDEDKCPMCYWTYDDDEEYFLDKSEDNGFCDRGARREDGEIH